MFAESAPHKVAHSNSSDQKLDVVEPQKQSSSGESKKADRSSRSIQPRQCSGAIEKVKEMQELLASPKRSQRKEKENKPKKLAMSVFAD